MASVVSHLTMLISLLTIRKLCLSLCQHTFCLPPDIYCIDHKIEALPLGGCETLVGGLGKAFQNQKLFKNDYFIHYCENLNKNLKYCYHFSFSCEEASAAASSATNGRHRCLTKNPPTSITRTLKHHSEHNMMTE